MMNVRNMFAGTSTSSTGDRMYVEIQQMWCGPVDYSRCEIRQRRKLGCRPWAAWHVECEDGSSRRNAGRADLADWRREWAVQDSVVPVHSEPYKPGPQFCTRYVPWHEASVMISVRRRCGLSGEADRSVVLTHSGRAVAWIHQICSDAGLLHTDEMLTIWQWISQQGKQWELEKTR